MALRLMIRLGGGSAWLTPAEVEVAFQSWVSAALERLTGRQVVLDGKMLRGSQDGGAKSALDLVSAWVHESGVVLGQREVDMKSTVRGKHSLSFFAARHRIADAQEIAVRK